MFLCFLVIFGIIDMERNVSGWVCFVFFFGGFEWIYFFLFYDVSEKYR